MKAAGIVSTIVGVLMLLSSVNLALTKYDLKSSHDLSKLFGSLGLSAESFSVVSDRSAKPAPKR